MKIGKKKIFFVVLAVLLISSAFISLNASSFGKSFLWGSQLKELKKESKELDRVIARVNNVDIKERDLEAALLRQDTYSELQKDFNDMDELPNEYKAVKLSREEMLEKLILDKTLLLEAEKEGCQVSYDEAKKSVEENKKAINDILTGKITLEQDAREIFDKQYKCMEEFAQGLGMNMDEYWEYSITLSQKSLTIDKLKGKITESMPDEDKKDAKKVKEYINNFAKSKRNSDEYKIEIL